MYEWIGKLTRDDRKLRAVRRVFGLLPRSAVFILLQVAGCLLYAGSKGVRERVWLNMRDLLGGQPAGRIDRFCREYFCNLMVTLYELLVETGGLKVPGEWRFEAQGEAHLQEALKLGRGAVLFSPHLGNFFFYYWHLSTRYPCLAVVTAGSPELRPLYLLFQEKGCRGLDYDAASPLELWLTLRRHLRDNGVVLLLGDFWRPSFPRASFFGRTSRSPKGAVVLSLENQVPIIPFYGWREKGFKHRMVFEPSLFLHNRYEKRQRAEAAGELNAFMERAIRLVPGQWFYWFNVHERWEGER